MDGCRVGTAPLALNALLACRERPGQVVRLDFATLQHLVAGVWRLFRSLRTFALRYSMQGISLTCSADWTIVLTRAV